MTAVTLTKNANNDDVIIVKARESLSGTDISAADVTVTLETTAGVDVAGETWPLALTYIGTTTLSDGSSGYEWRGTLADTLTVDVDTDYQADVIVDGGAGLRGRWTLAVDVEVRTS